MQFSGGYVEAVGRIPRVVHRRLHMRMWAIHSLADVIHNLAHKFPTGTFGMRLIES